MHSVEYIMTIIIMCFVEANIIILYNINTILIMSETYFNMYVKDFLKIFLGCFHKEKNLITNYVTIMLHQ